MKSTASEAAAQIAETLRGAFLDRPFGVIRFWKFAVVRPGDQSFVLVSTHADGDRLDLVLVHESRKGLAAVISVWSPEGLETAEGGDGIALRGAARLRHAEAEAWLDGDRYRLRTPRGEGDFAVEDAPALTLSR